MKEVRVGLVGLGNMGSAYVHMFEQNLVKNARLVAICDNNPEKMKRYDDAKYKKFADSAEMIRSGEIDAIHVATPHYSHTTIGIDALENGLHTMVEKPISVHKADAMKLIAAHKDKKLIFGAMFNQRTDPHFTKVKEIIEKGELGDITRVSWIITDWFRTQAYYDGGDWRATWKGEGGGVLLNQCPHNLDLMQWLFGMPDKVRAFCGIGKFHKIEVEDAVTAYLEYPNGATGVFITTTGEAPGTNRLEVCGENGKIVVEKGTITWTRNTVGQGEFLRTCKGGFDRPQVWNIDIPCNGGGTQHTGIWQNFIDAIVSGAKLVAPAEEGINSVELANAMLYSSFQDTTLSLPIDEKAYEAHLMDLIANSKLEKVFIDHGVEDNMMGSFSKI